MESFKLVMPGHLNHYGFLFGGYLLQWVDEAGYLAATLDYPGCNFVTVAMDKVEFRKSVRQGALLRFGARRCRVGTTSVQYEVEVFSRQVGSREGDPVFSTRITFVCLDGQGSKIPLAAGCGPGAGTAPGL